MQPKANKAVELPIVKPKRRARCLEKQTGTQVCINIPYPIYRLLENSSHQHEVEFEGEDTFSELDDESDQGSLDLNACIWDF